LSEPVTVTVDCPAPTSYVSPFLIIGVIAGISLLAVIGWLLFNHRRGHLTNE
jgi:hypothetical protein